MSARTAALAAVMLALLGSAAAAVPPGVGALVWSDDFNGTSLDLNKWNYRAPGPYMQGFNSPLTVTVGGGNLSITTYTHSLLPGVLPPTHYTGQISTSKLGTNLLGGFEGTYGYFEIRANFTARSGHWSGFWLQSPNLNGPTPGGVEIDIVEHRLYNTHDPARYGLTPTTPIDNRVHNALIWGGYPAGPDRTRSFLSAPQPGLSNSTWHKYGVKWTSSGYTFYYDDVAIPWNGDGAPVATAAQFVILSSQVNGAFAGAIPGGAGYGTLQNSQAKAVYDYVRIYSLAP